VPRNGLGVWTGGADPASAMSTSNKPWQTMSAAPVSLLPPPGLHSRRKPALVTDSHINRRTNVCLPSYDWAAAPMTQDLKLQ
jgi:hypothetical protein